MECPSYKLFDDREPTDLDTDKQSKWHDTIPIPAFNKVFIIMSFDAPEQIGRYVFHCHILKHEDRGLMAPIEILDVEALPLKPKPSPQ
jgi:FtsP/CotA-like multicopper oxidase with cupredoxin domain